MKVILDIEIFVKGKQSHASYAMLRKEYDTKLYPMPGIEIEDPAWKEPKVPCSIICSFGEGYYYLNFGNVVIDTEENCKREAERSRQ